MDEYQGLKELQNYLQSHQQPSYNHFIVTNQKNIVLWSLNIAAVTGAALNGIWYERYKKQYMSIKAKSVINKPKFNSIMWNTIMTKVLTRRTLCEEYTERSLDVLITAAQGATQEAKRIIRSSSSLLREDNNLSDDTNSTSGDASMENENESGESDIEKEKKDEIDINAALSEVGFKKLIKKSDESDLALLSSLKVQGDGIEERIHKQIIHLLSQENLTDMEKEVLKLLLSRAINCLDSTIYAKMAEVFSQGQLKYLIGKKQNFVGMDLMAFTTFDALLDKAWDTVDDLLIEIQTQKLELTKEKERKSDSYKLLHVLENLVEYFDIKIYPTASETTYYRRFALILDFVFKGLEVEMKDGEVVAEATKMAMEQNDYDDTNLFGRKIDVIINVKDSTTALNSNEWKASKTNHLKLKQQSKNIRSNCVILNNLYILTGGQVSSVMALDMIGTIGYLYLLCFKKNVYVATLVDAILLPINMTELKAFKKSLNALIKWRNFMQEQIKTIKNANTVNDLSSVAHDAYSEDQGCSEDKTLLPTIFFTPKNKRASKRTYKDIDSDE
ncbi:hypothetical protein BDA99DRAFT_556258 [Phascolomyces articulosus]|uniref:Uncharacterized protein n=1 Tax=Phascolomyces articulosus TaxID=60185 RepID=A0AAD5PHB9_9FUNG|nr:hypothetical protein BDA99DRAFT_556258 [Phascolomyces articulosus]